MLNSIKANKLLEWKSIYTNTESLFETIEWYKQYADKNNMKDFTLKQIEKYVINMTKDD